MPSLVIHLMLAAAVAAPAAPASMPTAFNRLEVTREVPIHPAMWEGTAHSCRVTPGTERSDSCWGVHHV